MSKEQGQGRGASGQLPPSTRSASPTERRARRTRLSRDLSRYSRQRLIACAALHWWHIALFSFWVKRRATAIGQSRLFGILRPVSASAGKRLPNALGRMSLMGHKRSRADLVGTSALNLQPDPITAKADLAADHETGGHGDSDFGSTLWADGKG